MKGKSLTSNPDGEVEAARVELKDSEFTNKSREELCSLWNRQCEYVDRIELQSRDLRKRERILVQQLSARDSEIAKLTQQLTTIKDGHCPTDEQLKATLTDPLVNQLVNSMRNELAEVQTQNAELKDELAGWKFTPDSLTGKNLMTKCKELLKENEDLGNMISNGRLAKLEGQLAMQRSLSREMKDNQEEFEQYVQNIDEDVEGMQTTVYCLQAQLKKALARIAELESVGENGDCDSQSSNALDVQVEQSRTDGTEMGADDSKND